MSVSLEDVEFIRSRAGFACEYCGVTETDCESRLTIDHFRPKFHGGVDCLENLVYCCWQCNLHKAAYWPSRPMDPVLWNPRDDLRERHLLVLADGRLHPRTPTGKTFWNATVTS